MPNYQNGKIYKLVSNISTDIYIGSTVNKLTHRLNGHKSKSNDCISNQLFKNDAVVQIILIEMFPCNSKIELIAREHHYITTLVCINKYIPFITDISFENQQAYRQAYIEANKDKIKAYRQTYNEVNKDKNKERGKEYIEANKDKIKAYKQTYNEVNKEDIKSKNKEYREANKDKIKECKKEYIEVNKDKIKEYDKEYREANKDKIKEQGKEYYEANKDKINERRREQRAKAKLQPIII